MNIIINFITFVHSLSWHDVHFLAATCPGCGTNLAGWVRSAQLRAARW